MNKIKNKIIILSVAFLLLFFASSASASQINLIPGSNLMKVGEIFQIDVTLDTEDETINAIEGTIVFPTDILELNDIRDGNSIINFWVEKTQDSSSGQFNFSGIVPGGYIGKNGYIASLIFKTKKEGIGNVEIINAKALLNNEESSESKLSTDKISFEVSGQADYEISKISKVKDEESPESFIPAVASDPNIFDRKYFLVFSAVDKISGIDNYKVLESKLGISWLSFSRWQKSKSPYLLKDQQLQSYIFIKASDKNGNERIEKISPQNPLVWYKNTSIIIYIVLLLLLIIFLFFIAKHFLKKLKFKLK
ncbi:MAG: cohesin domain-containing protein [Candidatus Paceibacterota bacterium]|jgi:hypothetical protein